MRNFAHSGRSTLERGTTALKYVAPVLRGMRLLGTLGATAFLLLASGCLQAATTGSLTGPGSGASPAEPTKLEALNLLPELKLGPGAGEPNVAVAPDGTIYVTPIDHVYRSKDGGRSYEDLGTKQTTGHGDGDIVVDAKGRLHWLGLGNGIPYQHSDDGGNTFTKAVDLSSKTGSDREWMDGSPDGHIYAAWRDKDGYVAITSADRGDTWGKKVKVSEDQLGGPIVVDPSKAGRVYIPQATFPDTPPSTPPVIRLERSDDYGATWKTLKVADVPVSPADAAFVTQIFPVAAVDQAGNIYFVVSVKQDAVLSAVPKPASVYGVFLWVSTDQGATWSEPQLLSTPSKAGIMPWIVAGKAGRVAVAWYENTLGAPNDVLPDEWNVKLLEGLHMQGPAKDRVVAVTQLNGQPNHIGSVCTNGTLCVAGGDRSLLDFFEVALTPQGQPFVTWASSLGGTGVGLAVQGTDIFVRGAIAGTPLL